MESKIMAVHIPSLYERAGESVPVVSPPGVIVFAADHGVVSRGVCFSAESDDSNDRQFFKRGSGYQYFR